MNSLEMTQNDGQNDLPSLSQVREEFTFNSSTSKRIKLFENLGRFKWFGLAVMALVIFIMFVTFNTSSDLKAEFPVSLSQAEEKKSDLVLSDKAKELSALWSREDSESTDTTDDDGEEGEDSGESKKITQETFDIQQSLTVLAADGTKFPIAWRALRTQISRFVVFRQNVWNVKLVDAKLGAWDSTFTQFKEEFPPTENAVGFIFLGNKGAERLYEVVYIPSSMDVPPAAVMEKYGLPTDPNVLIKYSGLPIAHTIIIKTFRELNALNIMKSAKKGGIISLWEEPEENESVEDETTNLLTVVDGYHYAPVWKTLASGDNRFAVFRKSPTNPQKIDVRLGTWNSLISDFQAEFPANQEAVGFFILGDKSVTALHEVVFIPGSSKMTGSQVLGAFALPADPRILNAPGLPVANTLVVRNLKDITTTNLVMNAKAAGIVTLWGWSSESSTSIASDGSAYADVWTALQVKTYRFVVFRQNADNSKLVDVDFGDWNATFPQFASLFRANKPQVGYIYLGTKNHEQLYEIVYCPTVLRTNPATVMVNFGLPPNPSKLATSYGLPLPYTFIATDKKQIDTGNVIMKAVAGGIIP